MTPISQRGQILVNLQKQLLTISKANGYVNDVYDVSFVVKTWDQVTEQETPVLYIVDETAQYQYHPGRLVEVIWGLSLYGVMKNHTQDEMEDFISDIDFCLTKNTGLGFPETVTPGNALGNVASQIRIRNITTDGQFFSKIDGSQLFKVSIDVLYTKCYGSR